MSTVRYFLVGPILGGLLYYLFMFLLNGIPYKIQAVDCTPDVNISNHSNCQLKITAESTQQVDNALSNPKTRFVRLNPIVRPYYSGEFWRTKGGRDDIGKYFWVWADGDIGQQYLSLPHNFVEMSLWTLSSGVEKLNINLQEVQEGCWVLLNVTEQFCILTSLFLDTVTQHHPQDSLLCYNALYLLRFGSHFSLSDYMCSNVSNVSEVHFSFNERRLSNFYSFELISISIAVYFSPVIIVLLLPKRFTVRYSPEWLRNIKKYEISGLESRTPLDESFSLAPESRVSPIIVVLFIFPIAHVPIFFAAHINSIYYADCATALPELFWPLFVFAFILLLLRAYRSTCDFKDLKKSVKKPNCYELFTWLHSICACEWETPDFNFVNKCFLGEYMSLQDVLTKFFLSVANLIKFICFHLDISRQKFNCRSVCAFFLGICRSFFVVVLGIFVCLPMCVIFLYFDMILTVHLWSQKSDCLTASFIFTESWLLFGTYTIAVSVYFLTDLVLVVTLTLAGSILNYGIVLNYVIFGLSVLYYIWKPFHDLQESYRILKAIVFKECSSYGLKYMKHVEDNSQGTHSSKSHEETNCADSGNVQATGSIQSSTLLEQSNGNEIVGTTNSENIPLLRTDNNTGPQHYSSTVCLQPPINEEEITYCGHVQVTDNAQSPTPKRDNDKYVFLYRSDENGIEIIPKDLWESIYKQLLPLDAGFVKSCITSLSAIFFAFFFVDMLSDFHMTWELQLIGQGVASLITVSIPRLVWGFMNTDASKDSLKRSWEVAVREKVNIYILKNEITAPGNSD